MPLIRLATSDDAAAVAAIYAPFCESTAISFEVTAPTAEEMSTRIAKMGCYFRATAGITLPNATSVGLHRSFGFTQVGVYRSVGFKLGAGHDVAWFETAIQPLVPDPAPPRAVASLMGTPAWPEALARGLAHIRNPGGTP